MTPEGILRDVIVDHYGLPVGLVEFTTPRKPSQPMVHVWPFGVRIVFESCLKQWAEEVFARGFHQPMGHNKDWLLLTATPATSLRTSWEGAEVYRVTAVQRVAFIHVGGAPRSQLIWPGWLVRYGGYVDCDCALAAHPEQLYGWILRKIERSIAEDYRDDCIVE